MAVGSTAGVMLVPFTGWRMLFIITAALAAIVLWILIRYLSLSSAPTAKSPPSVKQIFSGYKDLLATKRGLKTYSYVFWNGIFHSAIYTWLGLYFSQRYNLGEVGLDWQSWDMEYRAYCLAPPLEKRQISGAGCG
jgi:predicted MFS family arabinose efflux permease